MGSIPDNYVYDDIINYYRKFTLEQMTEKYKNLLREIYSQFDRETLIKVITTLIKRKINPKRYLRKYCEKRNVKGDECEYITDNIDLHDLLWDADKHKIIKFYENQDIPSLIDRIIKLTHISTNFINLTITYFILYNESTVKKIELDAYDANSQKLIAEYDNLQEERDILYEEGDMYIVKQKEYIFKYTKTRPDKPNDILHELFIGLTVTNNFKGFSKIYSGKLYVDCPSRIENIWKCSYLVGEYIEGTVFKDWLILNRYSPQDILHIFKIIINNLYEIHSATGFTHYDLHLGNIIITEDYEPIIIDYGLSYAKVKDVDIGGILPDAEIYNRPMWQHDIFKLTFIMYITLAYSDDEWSMLNKCANYYKYIIPCGNNLNYKNTLTQVFDKIKYFFLDLELKLDFEGEYDEAYDFFNDNYEELYKITVDKWTAMIFNKLLFIFTKEIKCKFYDGIPDDNYTIISTPVEYMKEYNQYGSPVGDMLTMTYPFSEFKDLVNNIDY